MSSLNMPQWGGWLFALGLGGAIIFLGMSIRRHHGVHRSLFSWPYSLWIAVFTVVPLFLVAFYAFTDKAGQLTLENFANFWDSNREMKQQLIAMGYDPIVMGMGERGTVNVDTLVYSLWMALMCTGICFVIGYPAALFISEREFKLGPTLIVLFIIPMWMNFLLRTVAWMTLLEDNGLINTLLQRMGLGRVRLMYNSQAVLLGMVYNYLPFMVFPVYNALSRQDYKLSEAAMDLGADKWRTFSRVTFPLSLPGIVSGITMVFMPSVTTFFIPRALGGGNTEMFGDLIERTFLTADNWNVGSALSLIMMLLILLSMGLLRKVDPEGEGGSLL